MSFDLEMLWSLLPAIHRIQDAEIAARASLLDPAEDAELQVLDARVLRGETLSPADLAQRASLTEKSASGPLRSLLRILAEQIAQIEEDIAQLYDDQFIETCAPWVVPYIGDLIGHRLLRADRLGAPRAEVANTINYRRGKGTARVLAGGALDLTGFPAAVTEYFQRLAVTQHLNHIRPQACTASLRRPVDPALVGGPFDTLAHGAEVGSLGVVPGRRYNIPNVGVHLWHLPISMRSGTAAFAVDAQRFLFDALGIDQPLLAVPQPSDQMAALPRMSDVPLALTRRRFGAAQDVYYGPGKSVSLTIDDVPVPLGDISVCCLQDLGGDPSTSAWASAPASRVVIDPELGRILLPAPLSAGSVLRVSYAFAGSDPIGAGEFSRIANFATDLEPIVQVPVLQPSLAAALASSDFAGNGVIEVVASGAMPDADAALTIRVAPQGRLEIRGGDGTAPVAMPASPVVVVGGTGGEVTLNGLTVVGQPIVVPANDGAQSNRLQRLTLRNCTLVPGLTLDRSGTPTSPTAPSLIVTSSDTAVEIDGCILGAVQIAREATSRINDSVLDTGDVARAAYSDTDGASLGGPVALNAVTVIGQLLTEQASLVSNTLLVGTAQSLRKQQGVVRYSYVTEGSALPRRYACVSPEAAPVGAPRPYFLANRFGTPGYLRLQAATPDAIRAGADDGGEMGAWHGVGETLRLQQLALWLEEYTRFGLMTGVFIQS